MPAPHETSHRSFPWHPPDMLHLRLDRKNISRTAVALATLNLLMLLGTAIELSLGDDQPWRVRYLALQLNLGHENNAAAPAGKLA
jgi:hypothetical protein